MRILRGMEAPTSIHTVPLNRGRAIRLSYANALLWAIGNGLVSTTLVLYLATGFGASPLAVSLVIASPRFVGLLRLWTPSLIQRVGDRRKFCLLTYLSSSLLLLALPLVAAVNWSPNSAWSIGVLIGVWATYHLLESLGTIALWSWLADLVPLRVRGRFIGQRNQKGPLQYIPKNAVNTLFCRLKRSPGFISKRVYKPL